ncbi:MAG: hypothetical protein ABEJ72_05475 [Candidatus Aenigmatarchaeota archaeon]
MAANYVLEVEPDRHLTRMKGEPCGEVEIDGWSFDAKIKKKGYSGRAHLSLRYKNALVYSEIVEREFDGDETEDQLEKMVEHALQNIDCFYNFVDRDPERSIAYFGSRDLELDYK